MLRLRLRRDGYAGWVTTPTRRDEGHSVMRLFAPLRHRDFALLSGGALVSLLGDGVFGVALAFQVYALSNRPSALSLVNLAWTVPMVLLLLAGGVLSDRMDRRRVMIAADLLRAAVIGLVALLTFTDTLRLWHLLALMPLFGAGMALFNPASAALFPDVLPAADLAQANALRGVLGPMMFQLVGPALGGVIVGTVGPGAAMAGNAASFVVSAAAVAMIAARPPRQGARDPRAGVRGEIGAALGVVRRQAWLWATLIGFPVGLLATRGPVQVLLPYIMKNDLGDRGEGYGVVLAAGGVGAIIAAFVVGQRPLPRRQVTVMLLAWAAGNAVVALYGVMGSVWQGAAVAFAFGALFSLGVIIWRTLMQTLVPRDLLGRVSSIDMLLSFALVPVSYALTGPVAEVVGARGTLVGGGILGGIALAAVLLAPGIHDLEREGEAPSVGEPSSL